MSVYEQLIVGTDGSDTAREAVERAAVLAAALDVPLLVASAYYRPAPHELGPPSERAQLPTDAWVSTGYRAAVDVTTEARLAAHAVAGDALTVDTVQPEGEPAEMLLELAEARPGCLLAVGNQGMAASTRFLLGNVPHKVSHHAVSDTLILRTGIGGVARTPRRMLIATDGSETATKALRQGLDVAAGLGAEVTLLTVTNDADAGRQLLEKAAAEADERGVDHTTTVRSGEPAEEILTAGEEHDLMVVGNRGMTGASRFMLGNVPNKVSHHATADLLIVKTK